MNEYDLIVIGGGVSGMTAALSAIRENINNILIIEREDILGGILNQCIHNGFGEEVLDREVTGPEYINYLEEKLDMTSIDIKLNTTVLEVFENKVVRYVSPEDGVVDIKGKAIVLATGCRERYTGNIAIPTNSLVGIYTVGSAHRIVTLEGYMPGKHPVIVANSKWALVLARRLVIEGARIQALIIDEWEDFSFNEECEEIIKDFNIPVIKNKTVVSVYGDERVKGIVIKDNYSSNEEILKCDCLILSVGYFPEKEVVKNLNLKNDKCTESFVVDNFKTSIDGIFACGNVMYGVHALKEKGVNGIMAGQYIAEYIKNLD